MTFKDDDFRIETKRGPGNGGQKRNKTDSMVVMTHISTGIKAAVDSRNQHQNKREARAILEERVKQYYENISKQSDSFLKKSLAGSGERGDKIRTYRYQDDIITDHRTGKKISLKKVMNGYLDRLF